MYVVRRADHWWFRKSVPIDIARIAGVPELRRSLRTRDFALAKRRALQLLVRVDEVYAILRSKRPLKPTRDLALAMLDDAMRLNAGSPDGVSRKAEFIENARWAFEGLPADHALGAYEDLDDQECPAHFVTKAEALGILRTERPVARDNEVAVSILDAVDRISLTHWTKLSKVEQALDSAMLQLAPDSATTAAPSSADEMIAKLCSALMTALAATRTASPPPLDTVGLKELVASEIKAGIAQAASSRWSDELLSMAVRRFELQEVTKLTGLKHAEDVPKRLANFLNFIGDKPIRDITRDELKDYRDHLDQLPDRFQLRLKTNDIRKAIAINKKRPKPFPTIGSKTVDLKYIGPVRRLFEWLVTEKKIESNPAKDIHSAQFATDATKSKRLPLKPDQISRLFAATAKEPKTSALYWLPPMMLFTGARLNEVAQLRTDDIRLDYNGRPHLSVLCLDDDDDEGADEAVKVVQKADKRGVKSAAARRLIPIHPELIKMGLLDFIASRHQRTGRNCQVFSELKPNRHGHWSAAISKRINRRLRSLGILNPRLSAYSLRHNFRDACVSAGMSDETRKKLMGHQLQGMDAVYGNPRPLPEESIAIDRIAFHDVDLRPYTVRPTSNSALGHDIQSELGRQGQPKVTA